MRRLLTAHLGWKFLSLGIAIALWMTLVGEQELTTSASAPIVFRNIPRDLEISSEVPDRIHLEIQGPVGKLGSLASPTVMLDLASMDRPGERTFTIRQGNVTLPPGVTLSRAVPGQLRLRFERRISREIPVQIRFSGPPPAGYRIVRQSVRPTTVMVVGPESRVGKVDFAETDPLDLTSVVSESEFRVHTYVLDQQVRVSDAQMVSVHVTLEKLPEVHKK
jgi:hypothetical protein